MGSALKGYVLVRYVLHTALFVAVAGFGGMVFAMWMGDPRGEEDWSLIAGVVAMVGMLVYKLLDFRAIIRRSNARMDDPSYVARLRRCGMTV